MANRFGGIPVNRSEGTVDYQPGPDQVVEETGEQTTIGGVEIAPYQMFAPVGGGMLTDVGKSVGKGVVSSPGAIKRMATETAKALSPFPSDGEVPIAETAKGVAGLISGGTQKIKGLYSDLTPEEQEKEAMFDSVIESMLETYGTYDGIKKEMETNLPGVIGDIAALTSGGGLGVTQMSKIPKLGKLAKTGEVLTSLGAKLEPTTAAIRGTKKAVEKIPQVLSRAKTPNDMYQSAVKFSTTLTEAKRTKLANTALKYGVMPTDEGLSKLKTMMDKIDTDIDKMISGAEKTNAKLKEGDLFKDFAKLEKEAGLNVKAVDKIQAVNNIKKQIIEGNKLIGQKDYTPAQAQKLKRNIYKDLDNYYEKVTENSAGVKASKAVAKQAKEFLEEIMPGIKEKNKDYGEIVSLYQELDRPVSRIKNRDLLGISIPIKVSAGATMGESFGRLLGIEGMGGAAGGTIGAIMGMLDNPKIKSKLAIVIDKLEKTGYKPTKETEAFKNLLYETRKLPTTEEDE